jgi:hypothetical protein
VLKCYCNCYARPLRVAFAADGGADLAPTMDASLHGRGRSGLLALHPTQPLGGVAAEREHIVNNGALTERPRLDGVGTGRAYHEPIGAVNEKGPRADGP